MTPIHVPAPLALVPAPRPGGPVDGDVVVTRLTEKAERFLVRQVPHPPVLSLPSRRAAVLLATRFARAYLVDLWLVEGPVLTRLERRRRWRTPPQAVDTPGGSLATHAPWPPLEQDS